MVQHLLVDLHHQVAQMLHPNVSDSTPERQLLCLTPLSVLTLQVGVGQVLDGPVALDRLVGPHWILVKVEKILQVAIPRLNLSAYGVQFQDSHEIQAAVRTEQAKRSHCLIECLVPTKQDPHVFHVSERTLLDNMRRRDFCKRQVAY